MNALDFRLLFESSPGQLLVLSPDLNILAATDAYLAVAGATREQIVGRHPFDVFPDNPDDPDASGTRNLRASLTRVIEHGVPDTMAVQRYDVQSPDGSGFKPRHWSPTNFPVSDADGRVAFIIHSVVEVTELVNLQGHDDRLALEVIKRGQELQDANARLRDLNAGLNARVAERTTALERANADLREEMAQSARLQEQMHRAQRLESIGTLAGGVAHDFNNLLTVIGGYSAMLMDREGLSPEDRSTLEEIHRAGLRAAGLTRQLLTFSRQQVVEPRLLSLNTILTGTERMLRRVIGEDLILTLSLDPEIGAIFADPGHIEQIVMNLAVNARDAMPDGGSLRLSTSDVVAPASSVDPPPGRYAQLSVADNGCGMSEDIKGRIFDPFFTTKPVGQGTGLGLATVFGIVSQSRGRIHVDSTPGDGTTFTMLFPVAADEAPQVQTELQRPHRGSGTVLIVEDDDSVRSLTSKALRVHGYRVLESSGGEDAMRICRDYPEEIHLLITDVIMPGMGGRKVADGVAGLRPGTPVLYVSGYTNDAVVRQGVEHDHVAFLQKPFTPSALIRRVQDVLGGRAGTAPSGPTPPSGS